MFCAEHVAGWSASYTVLVPTRVHTHQARIMVTESCLQDANLALESHLSGERLSPILMKTTDEEELKVQRWHLGAYVVRPATSFPFPEKSPLW